VKSKKHSSILTLPDVPFFVDRSLGSKTFAEMLKSAGFCIEVHKDHFRHDEKDPVWLQVCGEKGWIVLTSDKRIESQWFDVIRTAKVGVIIVYTYEKDSATAWFERIRKSLPKMLRELRKYPPPFVAHLTHDGIKWSREWSAERAPDEG
jgi:PIN domain-containing protein